MRHTAWSKSGLPSERLAPLPSASRPATPKASPKPSQSSSPVPKSKDVRRLELLLAALRAPGACTIKDPKGGCFCLARAHPLSPYTPLCLTCGLVLCARNPPQHVCPSCSTPLLPTAQARSEMADRVRGELDAQLAHEEREAERLRDEARARVGAFPTLPPHGAAPSPPPPPQVVLQPQSHKVLSLGGGAKGKGKGKITVSSYTLHPASSSATSVASTSGKAKEEEDADDGPPRVPPPSEPPYARKVDGRRWEDRRPGADAAFYVPVKTTPAPAQVTVEGQAGGGRRRRRKGAGGSGGGGESAAAAGGSGQT